jgi:phospholipase C
VIVKIIVKAIVVLLLNAICSFPGTAQISSFAHIVVVVQENRTPDNLFLGLCTPPYGSSSACGPGATQYDLQGFGFDRLGAKIPLTQVPLGNGFDPNHSHAGFEKMCHPDPNTGQCRMNGLGSAGCPLKCGFVYVQPADVHPYLTLAQQYGWANSMFQTNQGPSAPAHQFIFGGTSAASATDDSRATFVAENMTGKSGCLAPLNTVYKLISPQTAPREFDLVNNPLGTVCFSRPTMATLLDAKGLSWKYYTAGANGLWSAPNWIREICGPDANYQTCTGAEWRNHVDLNPQNVLKTDIPGCQLPAVSWVIPIGQNSDHPSADGTHTGGPSWVAAIVNAIGESACTDNVNGKKLSYWQDTAIIVTWDDWGGFYDHRQPTFLSPPAQGQGDYQLGFRVPLVVVSAYTNPTIDNANYDFGSILRFIERNFGMAEGALGFADKRSQTDLRAFFHMTQAPRLFQHINAPVSAQFFMSDQRPMDEPDDD